MIRSSLNEHLLLTLLDRQPDPVVYYIPIYNKQGDTIVDFEVSYCNAEAAHQTGVSVAELMGQKVTCIVSADEATRKIMFNDLLQVFTSNKKIESSYYNKILDRHYHSIRTKADHGVLTVAHDITSEVRERQEKERQAELSNLMLNTAINAWFSCSAIRNEKGEIVDMLITRINPEFTHIVGLKEHEVVGKSYLSIFPSAIEQGIFDMDIRVINSGIREREQRYYKGEHLNAWYDVAVSRLRKDEILVTFADITDLKNHELAAQQLAASLKTVFDAAQMGMFTLKPIFDEQGNITDYLFVMVNPVISNYVGQSPGALTGERASLWFPGYLNNEVFDIYNRTYHTGEPARKEIHYHSEDLDLYLDLQCVKMGDQLLITLTDYSALRRAQIDLERTVEELRRSNSSLEEFAHAASHDMKEPIRKIRYFTERIRTSMSDRLTPEENMLCDRMEKATERMRLLIDDLLEYSHVSHRPQETEEVNLNEEVQAVLNDLEVSIKEKDALIKAGKLPVIKGYKQQLLQLFQNLISNAIKYNKPDVQPVVVISSKEVKGYETGIDLPPHLKNCIFYIIEVKDNGIGFEQKDAERIFNVFTRLHGRSEYVGTGVGLSIVRKVVENHHGYIRAYSHPGEGATFRIVLPK